MKTILAMASFAAFAAAQSAVCVTGVVQPVTFPTICMQGETHYLAGTAVYLRSAVVPLARFVGQNVRVEGPDIGLVCRVLDVTAVAPASARLDSCGTPMPGCSLRFKVTPGAIGQYGVFGSLAPGFAPLGCAPLAFFDGSLLLGWPIHTFVVALFPGPVGDYVWPPTAPRREVIPESVFAAAPSPELRADQVEPFRCRTLIDHCLAVTAEVRVFVRQARGCTPQPPPALARIRRSPAIPRMMNPCKCR